MGAVIRLEIRQCGGQCFRGAVLRRGNALHQLGDAVAHKITVGGPFVGGPAIFYTKAVACVGQVGQRVQQGAVQVKQNGFVHLQRSFPKTLSGLWFYYKSILPKRQQFAANLLGRTAKV